MAEDQDDSQKTEDPTAKRLQEARDEGNLPLSRDLATWITLLGGVIAVAFLLPMATQSMMTPLEAVLHRAGEVEVSSDNFSIVMSHIFGAFAVPLLSIIGLLCVISALGWLAQTGLYFNMNMFRLKWERLNPIQGFHKLFSPSSLIELIKGICKLAVIGYIAVTLIKPAYEDTEAMTGMTNIGLVHVTYDLTAHIFFAVFLVFTIIAAADLFYQRATYFKKLRMTKSEVKEEFRQSEGDPHVKGRLKQIRMEKARKRMMAAVPNADVVITNPTHYAIALKYEAGKMQAPVVLAKGQDFIALKIREVAEAHKIPIVSNPPLARTLYAVIEIDEEIPPQHYRAVAEVISYVYRLRRVKPAQ
jgi:flagellar biosynthetic protein FlhB